ncbi:MAG: glycosyltransferase [Draconibacterium sp.]|nr:glycosyltransferase [Draconibacterium sp.]
MNRGVKFVKAPIIIFSDTNTILGKQSLREIVAKFSNPKTGCVAGEKRIIEKDADSAAGSGEGLYWKFESWIKKMDAELNSAVGAVGELFAIRTELFEDVEKDTLLDDFIISLRIAQKGYHIAYSRNAYAEETASLKVKEELKRKIRIAAGGIQTIFRLKSLLNPFRFGILSWQYFSHKVLRWTFAPVSLILIFPVNLFIVWQKNGWSDFGFSNLYLYFRFFDFFLGHWLAGISKTEIKIQIIIYSTYYFHKLLFYKLCCNSLRMLRFSKESKQWFGKIKLAVQ